MPDYHLSHLDQLEAEAIFVLRETAAQFENPALLDECHLAAVRGLTELPWD